MARIWIVCAIAMAWVATGCSVDRPALLIIEPSYSHIRESALAGVSSVNVTAGAEEAVINNQ